MRNSTKESKKFKQRRDLCIKVIGSQFPDLPEAKLMHAIIGQAIKDATSKGDPFEKRKARNFILGDMWPATICGVESEWIRKKISLYDLGWDATAQ